MASAIVENWSLEPTSKVVDIGGGAGAFARRLLKYTNNVHVVDHEPPADPGPLKYLSMNLNGDWPIADGSYDAAVALEVIEHVENPRHFMRQIFRIVRPGGVALITTPNQLSLSSKLCFLLRDYHRDFSDNCYPAHITALTRMDLERIAAETKFVARAVKFSDAGRIPSSARTWQSILPFLRGKNFSDSVAISLYKPVD